MSNRVFRELRVPSRQVMLLAWVAAAAALLAGCDPGYGYNTRPGGGYYGGQSGGYYGSGRECYQGCGYVRDIREVRLGNDSNAVVGTVIGAVVGGLIGNQVGGGKGKTAATVAGAVGGGIAGHEIGERTGQDGYGWRVVVQLDDGRYATVTQHSPPQARIGDYVVIRGDQVHRL